MPERRRAERWSAISSTETQKTVREEEEEDDDDDIGFGRRRRRRRREESRTSGSDARRIRERARKFVSEVSEVVAGLQKRRLDEESGRFRPMERRVGTRGTTPAMVQRAVRNDCSRLRR